MRLCGAVAAVGRRNGVSSWCELHLLLSELERPEGEAAAKTVLAGSGVLRPIKAGWFAAVSRHARRCAWVE